MKYKAVLFDFDDTLVCTWEVKWQQHKAVAKNFYGIDLSDDELRAHWGKPYDETLRMYYRNSDSIENLRTAKLSLENQFPVQPQANAVQVLQKLATQGITIGVLSSSARALVIADLTRLQYPINEITIIQGSEDTRVHKPDPMVFAPILHKLRQQNINPEAIVYIGDAVSDYTAATKAGLSFIGVSSGLTTRQELISAGANHVFESLGDIMRSLEEQNV